MEVVINLVHDTDLYNKETGEGVLQGEGLLGVVDFTIHFESQKVFFYNHEDGEVWKYSCELTDHNKRLVVKIK